MNNRRMFQTIQTLFQSLSGIVMITLVILGTVGNGISVPLQWISFGFYTALFFIPPVLAKKFSHYYKQQAVISIWGLGFFTSLPSFVILAFANYHSREKLYLIPVAAVTTALYFLGFRSVMNGFKESRNGIAPRRQIISSVLFSLILGATSAEISNQLFDFSTGEYERVLLVRNEVHHGYRGNTLFSVEIISLDSITSQKQMDEIVQGKIDTTLIEEIDITRGEAKRLFNGSSVATITRHPGAWSAQWIRFEL